MNTDGQQKEIIHNLIDYKMKNKSVKSLSIHEKINERAKQKEREKHVFSFYVVTFGYKHPQYKQKEY